MSSQDLPPDLAALERELMARDRPSPPSALRQRVLDGVRRDHRRPPRLPAWQFAAAVAAALLLGINLSVSVANNLSGHLADGLDKERLDAEAERLRGLVPELSDQEVYRQALLAQGAAQLLAAPVPSSSPESLLRHKDFQLWDTH